MKTHTLLKTLLAALFITIASPSFAHDKAPATPLAETPEQRVLQLERRLEEIKNMDVRQLDRSERKALRTEVRAIKKEAAELSGGVYISVGAILIIALLLILLL
jgi:hypothetical protein